MWELSYLNLPSKLDCSRENCCKTTKPQKIEIARLRLRAFTAHSTGTTAHTQHKIQLRHLKYTAWRPESPVNHRPNTARAEPSKQLRHLKYTAWRPKSPVNHRPNTARAEPSKLRIRQSMYLHRAAFPLELQAGPAEKLLNNRH